MQAVNADVGRSVEGKPPEPRGESSGYKPEPQTSPTCGNGVRTSTLGTSALTRWGTGLSVSCGAGQSTGLGRSLASLASFLCLWSCAIPGCGSAPKHLSLGLGHQQLFLLDSCLLLVWKSSKSILRCPALANSLFQPPVPEHYQRTVSLKADGPSGLRLVAEALCIRDKDELPLPCPPPAALSTSFRLWQQLLPAHQTQTTLLSLLSPRIGSSGGQAGGLGVRVQSHALGGLAALSLTS